ncbi:unnamed protein product [Caenorhabditis bovis]|uniref:EF-hand domain-containing protein n=1 Tax=Caenorhabditis bovis TaxID=2654633 RepID=A0A8S1F5W1_9PELO|nr:unnamed protein product [Caenorhabditis bovis]
MESASNSSSEESIFHEQTRKLYQLCDEDGLGTIGKDNLNALVELIPPDDLLKIRKFIGDQRVNESAFCRILKTIVNQSLISPESSMVPSHLKAKSLDDEMRELQSDPVDDPITEMLRKELEEIKQFESNADDVSQLPDVIIKKPLYRPIEPEMNIPKVSSLADELHAIENGGGGGGDGNDGPQELVQPDRIFKVVFVGDSAVGKTCFLHRFCHNRFKPLFNATIGVDFTVKTMKIAPNRTIAMQLWDTAGQERFRSITKQYFRKADGVVLMFDVTSEQSFLNVRNWIDSVKAGVDETTVMCLVGNKVDLFGNDITRNSVFRAGEKLASEFRIQFFETSAYTGYGIENCMRQMAESLQRREDNHLQEALKLDMQPNVKSRSWCCI